MYDNAQATKTGDRDVFSLEDSTSTHLHGERRVSGSMPKIRTVHIPFISTRRIFEKRRETERREFRSAAALYFLHRNPKAARLETRRRFLCSLVVTAKRHTKLSNSKYPVEN